MITVFIAVIQDLFWFVLGRDSVVTLVPTIVTTTKQLPPRAAGPLLGTGVTQAVLSETVTPSVDQTVSSVVAIPSFPLHEPVVMYVQNPLGATSRVTPAADFDTIQMTHPYGTAVSVSQFSGNYAHVLRGDTKGWLLKDDLTPHKNEVWPILREWVIYGAAAAEAVKIRALIQDSFTGGKLALPLQAGEYVLFRLCNDNRTIVWPDNRPRLTGFWQSILKGVPGIRASIMPKTDTVMEWQSESDGGRLAYVEAVNPDNTITTTCVGLIVAGQYTKQVWTQDQWRELRPVFIQVD
jgi:hypothetical protein